MKALLKKDIYTLAKQMRILLLLIAVFSLIPGYSSSSLAVMYAAMLPITAMAYDERSKWDSLAVMMPYSPAGIVMSKYALGYIGFIASGIIAFIANFVTSIINKAPFENGYWVSFVIVICIALIMMAVTLPLLFWLGVEKGRLAFFIVIAAVVVFGMALGDSLDAYISDMETSALPMMLGAVLISVAINAISMFIAIAVYRNHEH